MKVTFKMRYGSSKVLVPVMVLATCVVAVAQTPTYNLGRTPSAEEIRAWDISIGPEGKELPPGSGTAEQGAPIYAQKCAACHGSTGAEARGPSRSTTRRSRAPLVGGQGTLTSIHPVKSIGSYWPYATTVWDYINRAMPADQVGSLTADEVYALTALLLYRNGIIQESDVIDAKSLPEVRMPNRNGFVPPVEKLSRWRCRQGPCP